MPDPTCYCHALRKATRRLNAAYDAALAPTGINVAQFSLLRTLARHGAQSLTGLGRRMELDRSTVGRNVKVVERLGLVQPASTTDQRQAAIELSPEGRRILASATPLWAGVQARIDTRLGPDRSATLLAELGRTHYGLTRRIQMRVSRTLLTLDGATPRQETDRCCAIRSHGLSPPASPVPPRRSPSSPTRS